MKNFESGVFENITADQAYIKAKSLEEGERIQLDDFKDLYGEKNVSEDQEYVKKMESIFIKEAGPEQENTKKLAAIFEEIIHEQVELSDWLGPDVCTIKPSRYDDIKNGVDSIAELQESEHTASYLALAIDATFSSEIEKKLYRIKKEIESGELAKIKYFASDHMNFRGEIAMIPRVIIGAEAKTIKNLSELWLEGKNKDLGSHKIQFQIIEEMLIQFGAYKRYAEKVNQPEIASIYSKVSKLVQEICDKKKEILTDSGQRDNVFFAIQKRMESF